MRRLVVNWLYQVANMICIVADRLSPADDSVWRKRQWEHYLARQEAEVDVSEPELLGSLLDWPERTNGE